MDSIDVIADAYIERVAALDPVAATGMGVPGHETDLPDLSPDGAAARAALDAATLTRLQDLSLESDRDRRARDVMSERLALNADLFAANEHLYDLNIIASPLQRLRGVFDLMPSETAGDWENIAARLERVGDAVAGARVALQAGLVRGLAASARQVSACATQADTWAGVTGGRGFFADLLARYDEVAPPEPALRARLAAATGAAASAYAGWSDYLRQDYLPRARQDDAVGPERYALRARVFTGLSLDLAQTYAWGWEEVRRIRAEMAQTARRIVPDGDLAAAVQILESDPARAVDGVEAFRRWMQDLQDRTMADLDGRHFDIPPPVRRIEALIAPPGGALAMYYTGPSEDFARPGRTWYPTGGRTRFPTWAEVSVAFHEGVPGHHLQIATTRHQGGKLTRFQRLLAGTSGYTEGWALYAERLMSELGYLDNPDHYLGYLSSQGMRAARVVLDIGLHLGLPIPDDEPDQPGQTWQPEFALPFLQRHCFFPADMLASEVDRYLGWPGQAISYKVGERAWLAAREAARGAAGGAFDLKTFHATALEMGPMGLDQLEHEMGRSAADA